MVNLSTLQDHLETIKSGTPDQKKQKLTPESIAEVRAFIASERANRQKGTNYSLEGQFHEWEDLISKYESERGLIVSKTANATANTAAGVANNGVPQVVGALGPSQSTGVTEIREKLNTINPENLEQAIGISEKIITVMPEPMKSTLRGVHGAVIFDILRSAGHNLTIQNGQISIIPKTSPDVVNLQEKLQTLVNTKRLSLDTLKLGMLYSSPSFKTYSELKITKDSTGKEIIDPKANPQDFINYLKYLKKAGNTSGDIETILGSQDMLRGVNMPQAIKGFQDIGQLGDWTQNNQQILTQTSALVANIAPSKQSNTPTPVVVPPEPNTTLTSKVLKDGVTGGQVTGVVGDATKGLVNGLGDIMSLGKGDPLATLGIGAALIYGIYKAFSKFGFLGGLGALFGAGAMNNIEKIMGRFGVDIGDTAEKAKKAAEEAAEKAKAAVASATGGAIAPAVGPANAPTSKIQNDLRKKVEASGIGSDIDKLATAKNSKYPGKLDDYLKFIETDLKDVPLSKLFPADHKESIFFDNFVTSLPGKPELSAKILKRVLREYLIGNSALTGTGDKLGEKEKTDFLTLHKLTPADIQTKNLSQILESVHKVRTGGVAPTPTTVPVIAGAAPAIVTQKAPAAASVATVTAPAAPTNQKNTFKIAGVDKIPTNNVETSVNAPVFDANGNPYKSTSKYLKIDSSGVVFAPTGSVVKLGTTVIQRQGVEHVEVEYAGEKFYIAITHLKP